MSVSFVGFHVDRSGEGRPRGVPTRRPVGKGEEQNNSTRPKLNIIEVINGSEDDEYST